MAIRVSSNKILQNLRNFTRTSSSIPIFPLNFDDKPEPEPESGSISLTQNQILDLDDTRKLFSAFSTTKLLKSTVNLSMAAVDPMVDMGMWVMRSKLMETPLLRDLILGVIKHSFYEQFVAGSGLEETGRTVERIWDTGLRSMLVYGLEHAHENEACDKSLQKFLETAEFTALLPPSSVSFAIVKISAICPVQLLERLSDLLRWQERDPSFHLPWKQNTLPLFSKSSPLYHTLEKPDPLTRDEENDLQLAVERLDKLCKRCAELNVPLTVDAEDSNINPGIDYLTYKAAIEYNKGSRPIVFGTIQAYLKDARERLLLMSEAAEKMGVGLGIKLVRGAYMSSETKLANSLGFESPIHDTIHDTHNCYNDCASYMLDKVAHGSSALVLATHNVESGKLAASKARDMGVGKENERFQFAQLYGMSDTLSYGLNNAGFNVSKYLTFGPVDEVMPYLLRRAEENRGMLSSSSLDRQLMSKELKRRVKAGFSV